MLEGLEHLIDARDLLDAHADARRRLRHLSRVVTEELALLPAQAADAVVLEALDRARARFCEPGDPRGDLVPTPAEIERWRAAASRLATLSASGEEGC